MKNEKERKPITKKKIIVLICAVLCVIFLSALYTTPSKWLSTDKEITEILILKASTQEEVTLKAASEIETISSLIRNTRTKVRIYFYDEETVDESDSGLLFVFYFNDGSTENVSYSSIHKGFVDKNLNPRVLNISFYNKALLSLIGEYFD